MDGFGCWEQLGLLLAWEADDPEMAAEHFLTVACYNLQHPAQFTDEALAWLTAGFIERVDRGAAVEALRRDAAYRFAGPARVLRPVTERRPVRRARSRTVADGYTPARPRGAAARVRAWAAAVRRGLDPPPAAPPAAGGHPIRSPAGSLWRRSRNPRTRRAPPADREGQGGALRRRPVSGPRGCRP